MCGGEYYYVSVTAPSIDESTQQSPPPTALKYGQEASEPEEEGREERASSSDVTAPDLPTVETVPDLGQTKFPDEVN